MQNEQKVDLFSGEPDRTGDLGNLQVAALEAAANAVVITDRAGTVIWVNPAFQQLTGYTRAEIVGQTTRVLKSGKNSKALYDEMWRTIRGGKVWRGDLINRRKDGSLYDEEMTITPVQDASGEITHYLAIKLDVSERKALAAALFAEKERAQVTLNSIADAVICTDASGNITFMNATAEKMTGWPCQRAAGKPIAEVLRIVDATTRKTAADPMEMAFAQDRTMSLPANCILIGRKGFETPIEDCVSPIHDRNKQAIGSVIVFRDVSAARAMALQMAHSAAHDFLTGLPNRMLLSDRVSQSIALAFAYRGKSRPAVFGFGRLQTHQRFPGTRDGRQSSSIGGKTPAGMRARLGHRKPPGRR